MLATASAFLTATSTRSDLTQPRPDPASLDLALKALETYDHGSGRGALMPLDDAIQVSLVTPEMQPVLERRLIEALEKSPSPVATEYISGKLALIGSKAAVPILAALLSDAKRREPARNALGLMPCTEAVQALRDSLAHLTGTARIGVIQTLGERRDTISVPELCLHLHSPDSQLAAAAAGALGQIGSVSAGGALREFLSRKPAGIGSVVADACLVCAGKLEADQQLAEARKLYLAVKSATVPAHIRGAAQRALTRLES
jgi:HEAT repeat protein